MRKACRHDQILAGRDDQRSIHDLRAYIIEEVPPRAG